MLFAFDILGQQGGLVIFSGFLCFPWLVPHNGRGHDRRTLRLVVFWRFNGDVSLTARWLLAVTIGRPVDDVLAVNSDVVLLLASAADGADVHRLWRGDLADFGTRDLGLSLLHHLRALLQVLVVGRVFDRGRGVAYKVAVAVLDVYIAVDEDQRVVVGGGLTERLL